MSSKSRGTVVVGLVMAAALTAGCQPGKQQSQAASPAALDLRRTAEGRKDEMIRQLAQCETGGAGPSERPIYGGRGAYLGRLQFSPQTVIGYQLKKDGSHLTGQQAAELAHDYDRSAELAKYMIFDLEEPFHWPRCSKLLSLRNEIAAVKELASQAQAAEAKSAEAKTAATRIAETQEAQTTMLSDSPP